MLKLRQWFANRRKPLVMRQEAYKWPIVQTKWFAVWLCVQLQSDTETSMAPRNAWILLLDGGMLMHYEDENPKRGLSVYDEGYSYVDSHGNWMRRLPLVPHDGFFLPSLSPFQIELHPANTFKDQVFGGLDWMGVDDLRTDTERHCWYLRFSWGGP